MRLRDVAVAVALFGFSVARADSPPAEDVESIRSIVADLDRAWAESDADRWAAHYLPDAEFINILGMVMPNAAAMRARHHEIFTGVFKGSRHHGVIRSVRSVGADVAIVDVDIEVTEFAALPPGARPTAPGVLRTRMRHVMRKTQGRWQIAATQNTAVAPNP